jgi:hypothetical protein
MLLRYIDDSVSVAANTKWQTAIHVSGIARFNRFYGHTRIKLFDSANGIQYFRQAPFDGRLECPQGNRDTVEPAGHRYGYTRCFQTAGF